MSGHAIGRDARGVEVDRRRAGPLQIRIGKPDLPGEFGNIRRIDVYLEGGVGHRPVVGQSISVDGGAERGGTGDPVEIDLVGKSGGGVCLNRRLERQRRQRRRGTLQPCQHIRHLDELIRERDDAIEPTGIDGGTERALWLVTGQCGQRARNLHFRPVEITDREGRDRDLIR